MCKQKDGTPPQNPKSHHYIWPFVVGAIIVFILVLTIIQALSFYEQSPSSCFSFSRTADKWIAIASAILSYGGTCFIGIVAMWQNRKLSAINDQLLKIEELRIAPKFKCKPGSLNFPNNGGTDSCIIIEHIGGECALDLEIKDLKIFINGVEFLFFPEKHDIPKRIYAGQYQFYKFSCAYTFAPDDELSATFTLCYLDSLGTFYQTPYSVPWKSLRAFSEDHNRSDKANSFNVGKIPVSAISATSSDI